MSRLTRVLAALLLALTAIMPVAPAYAQDEIPAAEIQNDEGGPAIVEGEMNYTNPENMQTVAQPLIVLEDQAGFIDRNRGFLLPPESQILGVITGDFFSPPFTWTLSLPIVPQGSLRDVDNDGETDEGVMTYAVAFWSNVYGDPYLERRDLSGGGWSTAYASTHVKTNPSGGGEVIGGKYIVWAPDDQQGFPSGFGEDGKLFTEDDPIVRLPAGYTVVDMDTSPFTFDRSQRPFIELIEPEDVALDDFSDMSYTEAFDAMLKMFREEYAFTELKGIDWDAMEAVFRPRFAEAEANEDYNAYRHALRDFMLSIPDTHIVAPFIAEDFQRETGGGLGMAIRDLDEGRTIVNFVTPGGPAERAGIELGAEITEMGGQPVDEFVAAIQPYSGPFGSQHFQRLQQLRYATRAPLGTEVSVTFRNPESTESQTVTLTAEEDPASFRFSSFNSGRTGVELPVEFKLLDNGLGYVKVYSFFDNELLTIQLWEQMMKSLNSLGVPGLIIDMRQNGGGSGTLADQMAAYFFNDELVLGNTEAYDQDLGKFYADPNTVQRFYPPDESLQYQGSVAVLIGPNCASACEFFTYNMTRQGRADVIGQYPTAGAGGARVMFLMPGPEQELLPLGRPLDAEGNIIVEGTGVAPTIHVPVTEETLFAEGDVLLDTAAALLLGKEPLPYGAGPNTEPGKPVEASIVSGPAPAAAPTVAPTEEPTEEPAAEATSEAATPTATEAATATEQASATERVTVTLATSQDNAAGEASTGASTEPVTATAQSAPAAEAAPEGTATQEVTAAVEATAEATAVAGAPGKVKIESRSTRILVFSAPNVGSTVLGIVANGSEWSLLETSADGEWVRIDYRGSDPGGWVKAQNVISNP